MKMAQEDRRGVCGATGGGRTARERGRGLGLVGVAWVWWAWSGFGGRGLGPARPWRCGKD